MLGNIAAHTRIGPLAIPQLSLGGNPARQQHSGRVEERLRTADDKNLAVRRTKPGPGKGVPSPLPAGAAGQDRRG
jgi:hypothetical protein